MTKDLLIIFVLRISKLIEWWNSNIAAYVLKMRSLEVNFFFKYFKLLRYLVIPCKSR